MMPYAIRNQHGQITALLSESSIGAEEYLPADHPDIAVFLSDTSPASPHKALADSDKDIARVTEDLVHLLIAKNVILFTELPPPVQRKLLSREKLRSSMQGSIENFLDEDETI